MKNKKYLHVLEFLSIFLVLSIIVIYTYAYFIEVPYFGFLFNISNGSVEQVWTRHQSNFELMNDDQILSIVSNEYQNKNLVQDPILLLKLDSGDVIDLEILREDHVLMGSWKIPGFNNAEFFQRLMSQWWIAYVFWLFGTISLLSFRPRNSRQILLVGFNFISAIWIIAGAPSSFKIWGSHIVLRSAIWLCIPVYWQFHHIIFSDPQVTEQKGKRFWIISYLIAGGLVIGEIFNMLPRYAFYIGFIFAITGSLAILFFHAVISPKQRRELGLLAFIIGLLLTPILFTVIFSAINQLEYISLLSFMLLPALPFSYFYIISRRYLGNLEFRTNQVVIFYLYGLLLFITIVFIVLTLETVTEIFPSMLIVILVGVVAGMLSTIIYPIFRKWAEQKLLGLTMNPSQLLENFAIQITTSLDKDRFVSLIQEKILPSLLIRQAALLRLDDSLSASLLFMVGVNPAGLTDQIEIDHLLDKLNSRQSHFTKFDPASSLNWVQIAFKLEIENDLIGLFMIGRRDPDDYYSPKDILTLQALANQIALALKNIDQADNLSMLYQNHLKNQEAESNRLARELHDEVLSQLAMVMMNLDRPTSEYFDHAYRRAVQRIRTIIEGLRPALLDYGLFIGLQNLTDEVKNLSGDGLQVELLVPHNQIRYDEEIEFHVYRIVQQACKNVLEHAQASSIIISGLLEENQIELIVSDDGVGFSSSSRFDLSDLLARKHFGLAGMYERASLIGARIKIYSQPNRGTQVKVTWSLTA